jgi:hypothetical protein
LLIYRKNRYEPWIHDYLFPLQQSLHCCFPVVSNLFPGDWREGLERRIVVRFGKIGKASDNVANIALGALFFKESKERPSTTARIPGDVDRQSSSSRKGARQTLALVLLLFAG